MANIGTATLYRMSESTLTIESPAADVRGRRVLDRTGKDIGTVNDLMIDDRESRVRFLRVGVGGILGVGETTYLLPVDAITSMTADEVRIDKTAEHVEGGPGYTPELVNDEVFLHKVYDHYGYQPYWAMGYKYPMYPIYPRTVPGRGILS